MTTPEIERAARALCEHHNRVIAPEFECGGPRCACSLWPDDVKAATAAICAALGAPSDTLIVAVREGWLGSGVAGHDVAARLAIAAILNHLCPEQSQ